MGRDQDGVRRSTTPLILMTLGVLAGFLGMHLLGLHGVQHDASSVTAHPYLVLEHDSHAEATPKDCCDPGHGVGSMVTCLFVLAGALIVLAAAGLLRGSTRRPTRSASSGSRLSWDRPVRAGPPFVWDYSVIRC